MRDFVRPSHGTLSDSMILLLLHGPSYNNLRVRGVSNGMVKSCRQNLLFAGFAVVCNDEYCKTDAFVKETNKRSMGVVQMLLPYLMHFSWKKWSKLFTS